MACSAADLRQVFQSFGHTRMRPSDFCHALQVIGIPSHVSNSLARKFQRRGMVRTALFCDWLHSGRCARPCDNFLAKTDGQVAPPDMGCDDEMAGCVAKEDREVASADLGSDDEEDRAGYEYPLAHDFPVEGVEESAPAKFFGKGVEEGEVRRLLVRFSSVYSEGGTETDLRDVEDKCTLSSRRERRAKEIQALEASFAEVVRRLEKQPQV
eukprot:TRINITY_DN37697_c0_g1_i1.p1 TRINITY_DN37697_c0_g1~~TRINITY_DN37697_c0_g1_i1.p1  ORF type:complete len:211 (+),score=34.33 TRINITY_DN37697_c0_g1_i1:49-681(+)